MSFGIIVGEAVDAFLTTYKKSPIKTTITIILFIALASFGISQNIKKSQDLMDYRSLKDATYTEQISQLNDIESNVKSLLIFLASQKQSIEENKKLLSKITEEQSKASSLLSMDQKQVNLLFAELEARQEQNRWKDIAIGVVGSLVASLIWSMISVYRQKHV